MVGKGGRTPTSSYKSGNSSEKLAAGDDSSRGHRDDYRGDRRLTYKGERGGKGFVDDGGDPGGNGGYKDVGRGHKDDSWHGRDTHNRHEGNSGRIGKGPSGSAKGDGGHEGDRTVAPWKGGKGDRPIERGGLPRAPPPPRPAPQGTGGESFDPKEGRPSSRPPRESVRPSTAAHVSRKRQANSSPPGLPLPKQPVVATTLPPGDWDEEELLALPPPKTAAVDGPHIRVWTKSTQNEIGLQTLVGEYKEHGMNHGKKCYKKIARLQSEDVFLYYWDNRDGSDFTGWWFGDAVGGSEVWSRAEVHDQMPPQFGWRIPWDGPATKDLLVVDPIQTQRKSVFPGACNPYLTHAAGADAGGDQRANQACQRERQADEDTAWHAAEETKMQEREQADRKSFQDSLPSALEIVATSEDVVEAAVILSKQLEEDGDGLGNYVTQMLSEVEQATSKATKSLSEAKKQLQARQLTTKKYAPLTRKAAQEEFTEMLAKLDEVGKKLVPLRSIRSELEAAKEARKAVGDIMEKISDAEFEVEKVSFCTHMTEAQILDALEVLPPRHVELVATAKLLEARLRKAGGSVKQDTQQMLDRCRSAQRNLNETTSRLTAQGELLASQQLLQMAAERLEGAEDAMLKVEEAEMPFLRGVEALPNDEAAHAIKDCESATANAETAISRARTSLKAKVAEAKRYSDDCREQVMGELSKGQSRLDVILKKLVAFKKETGQRKARQTLEEVIQVIIEAESQLKMMADVAKLFTSDTLEEISVDQLKSTGEQATSAGQQAADLIDNAQKLLAQKHKTKEAKDQAVATELGQLKDRLTACQHDLAKCKREASAGDRLIKSKHCIADQAEKLQQVEAAVARVEDLARPTSAAGQFADEQIQEVDAAVLEAQESLDASVKSVDEQIKGALPQVKAALSRVVMQTKKAQSRLDAVKAATKAQRERVLGALYVREGTQKIEEVEALQQKLSDAEKLLLELEGSVGGGGDSVKALDEVSESMQQALTDARAFVTAKTQEVRSFSGLAAKTYGEGLHKLTVRTNAAAQRLAQFRKDMDVRRRDLMMHEASEKVGTFAEEVKRATETAALLTGDVPPERVMEICERLAELDATAKAKEAEATDLFAKLVVDIKSQKLLEDKLKRLRSRMEESRAERLRTKKAVSEHEQRFAARKLIVRAEKLVEEVDQEVEQVVSAADPILVERGDSFVAVSNATLFVDALRELEMKNGQSRDTIWSSLATGALAGKVEEDDFKDFLRKAPDMCQREDITFTEEQTSAIFRHCAKDGAVSRHEFDALFREQYRCILDIALTDKFSIGAGKAVGKLEVDDVVEAFGDAQINELGIKRLECEVPGSGLKGWVTMQGNQGTKYLDLMSPFDSFAKGLDERLERTIASVRDSATILKQEAAELAAQSVKGPLVTEKEELAKLTSRMGQMQKRCAELKKQITNAKRDVLKRLDVERRGQLEVKDRKFANKVLEDLSEKMKAVEKDCSLIEEILLPLWTDQMADVPAPSTLFEKAEATLAILEGDVAAVKGCHDKHGPIASKASGGPLKQALVDLSKTSERATALLKRARTSLEKARSTCASFGEKLVSIVTASIREEVQKRKCSAEELFAQLLPEGEDMLPEEVFRDFVLKLPGSTLSDEHARLLLDRIGSASMGREMFLRTVQKYNICVKPIACTDSFDISTGKTLRMLELEEIVEVLEGPRVDTKLGLTRVLTKATRDGIVGWVSVKGNQGTPFLQETTKPFLITIAKVPIELNFEWGSSTGLGNIVRMLNHDEIVEVLEGPRNENLGVRMRARVRVVTDGITGWVTMTDRDGKMHTEARGKRYVCKASITFTEAASIQQGKNSRKLEVGEAVELLEGPIEEDKGMTRIRCRALRDDVEGWVTTRGVNGTVYLQEKSEVHFVAIAAPLQKRLSSASEEVRRLDEGELIEILEGPKEERADPVCRIRCRAFKDGVVGWVTRTEQTMKVWTPHYRCVFATPLQEDLASKDSKIVRRLEVGETVESLAGPTLDPGETGVLRIRARTDKDHLVGWMTIRGNQGKEFLRTAI